MIQHLDMLLGQCIDESRSVTMELSPPVLYDAGLASALEWLARQMQLNYGLLVEVEADVKAEPEAEDIKVLLFQSVRELLFNVVKHAGAQNASVKMSLTPDQQVRIDVVDKGAGFNAEHMQPTTIKSPDLACSAFGNAWNRWEADWKFIPFPAKEPAYRSLPLPMATVIVEGRYSDRTT